MQPANLLVRLPLADVTARLVYSSHFLEHIPRDLVAPFLQQCWRILKPGGLLRLVVPDLKNLCRNYLQPLDQGEYEKAYFMVLELLDQCVRRQSCGALGCYYQSLKADPRGNESSKAFVRERAGEELMHSPPAHRKAHLARDPAAATSLCRAPLDAGRDQAAAARLPRAEHERGRAPSLALRRPQPHAFVECQWFRGDRALHGIHQPPFRFPLPSARPGCRWPAAQGHRVVIHRGAEAPLTLSTPAASAWGGRHG
ncbi:methyltransferase domain-containing protein [Cyanobium sp. Tous-M-B4]|nr:methyltransferase domain-containing protein [Cyanobium sp. Tous-M-B4]MCP9875230.1 methyltransferase domain-containing protein [Cyanobium sp. A2C-AMD]